jgi:hypothetical protein
MFHLFPWDTSHERRHHARLLVALAIAAAALTAARIGVGGQTDLTINQSAMPPPQPAIAEPQPPLLMYDVRRALEQMERQV